MKWAVMFLLSHIYTHCQGIKEGGGGGGGGGGERYSSKSLSFPLIFACCVQYNIRLKPDLHRIVYDSSVLFTLNDKKEKKNF